MNIELNDIFKNSFVITVDDKRYSTFVKNFADAGLDTPSPKKFIGFQLLNGAQHGTGFVKTNNICNCAFSHIAIIKMAQTLGLDYACVFEDDAMPCRGCRDKLEKCILDIPDGADLVKFGYSAVSKNPVRVNGTFEQSKTTGSHAYMIFKKYYSAFIENAYNDLHIDQSAMNDLGKNIYQTSQLLFAWTVNDTRCCLHDTSKYLDTLRQLGRLVDFDLQPNYRHDT